MENEKKTEITVQAKIAAPLTQVWKLWTGPEHIVKWNNASDDWHTPASENDLRIGGRFKSTMAAKDGSMSFDFEGTYTDVQDHSFIAYALDDDRKVSITFQELEGQTEVVETFEAESMNPVEMQQGGWQAILNNFKKYAEEYS